MSDDETQAPQPEQPDPRPKKLDPKTVIIGGGLILMLVLLIALNMN